MKIRITQYGYPTDATPDSNTKNGVGSFDNPLTEFSCALCRSTIALFNAKQGELFLFFIDGKLVAKRYYHDVCPTYPEPRIDWYQPKAFNHNLPDYMEVIKHAST